MNSAKSPAEIRLAHQLYCIAHGYDDSDIDFIGTQLEDDLLGCINESLTAERAEHAKTLERHDKMAAYLMSRGDIRDQVEWGFYIRREIVAESSHTDEITEAALRYEKLQGRKGEG